MSEHNEQVALFQWAETQMKAYPELKWFHAIPNGGKRSIGVAKKLKAEGVKSGVLDTFLPVARCGFPGLYIEMKYGKNKLSDKQLEFKEFVENEGYKTVVCYNWYDAAQSVLAYLNKVMI